MNKVVIMRGLPGSGKSRYANDLAETVIQSVVCSADKFFEREVSGLPSEGTRVDYDFDPTLLPEAHAQCFREFVRALNFKTPLVIVDNTNIHRWEYLNYVLVARLAGYAVEVVEFRAKTLEEVKLCIRRNTHRVPAVVVSKLAIEFEPDDTATVNPIS